ncbi:uncharacterized protein [Henckelia pumila]|uniref:uncharacterized protein n=1 Tax=Henckelia pumila TaxID=405737 RepID=UPI003C6E08FD
MTFAHSNTMSILSGFVVPCIDESLATGANEIYTFRAHGSIYHSIGSLQPTENSRPRREDKPTCKLIIKEQQPNQRQYNLPTTSQVAAVIVDNECPYNLSSRDIIVQGIGGHLMNIQDIVGYYDPLQYPLLLSYGTYGWDTNSRNIDGTRVTCLNYYTYMLQIRENSSSLLLRGGRIFQQYVVDNYVKIETHRLRWIRTNQHNIRSDLYQGLQDCLDGGENNAGNVGHKIVLPSTFVGSPCDMYQRYQDAMALVQTYGKPDLMLTMTCNPNWHEIKEQLLPGQSPQDRPDLITRIFKLKFEEFKKDVVDRGVIGRVRSYSYVIKYQKRGLPHVHMLVIFDNSDKVHTPTDFDSIVRAEIPSQRDEPSLYEAVIHHMIHGPCGLINPYSPCMKDGKCKKNFPKPFVAYTSRGNDSYPLYQRREDFTDMIPLPKGDEIDTTVAKGSTDNSCKATNCSEINLVLALQSVQTLELVASVAGSQLDFLQYGSLSMAEVGMNAPKMLASLAVSLFEIHLYLVHLQNLVVGILSQNDPVVGKCDNCQTLICIANWYDVPHIWNSKHQKYRISVHL